MKKIVGLILILFISIMATAEEDFDTFDDEESSFVIKTKKPKIVIKKDSVEEKGTVKFTKESVQSNEAIEMDVKNFLIFSKLKDIDARYLVMELSLKNILKPQKVIVSKGSNHPASWINKSNEEYEYKEAIPLYQIPDIMQHLYLRVNNEQEKPIDIMSLLLDKPLIDFDSNTVEILPEKLKEGQLAFRLAKGKKIEQLSLHYYDTKYGNINLPIIGEMKAKTVDVTTLPKTAWKKMNDNFALSVTGYDTTNKIGNNKAKEDGQFEIVEIDIESKVYALLQFNPAERFYLKVGNTHRLKLHPITQALPMGLYSSASLSPGSNNKFRLAFYVPKGMEKLSRSLMIELQGEDIVLPIKKGENGSEKTVLAKGSVEGTDVKVNGVYLHDDMMLVDVTFSDKKDAYSTRLNSTFYLNNEPKWHIPSQHSDKILGYKNQETILDGNRKRVFLWFSNPFKKESTKPWYLVSPIFKDLKFKIEKEPKPLPENLKYFLAKTYPYQHKFDAVEKKVLAMVKTFRAKKSKEEKAEDKKRQLIAKLESKKEKSKYITIPPMLASSYGEEKLAKIKSTKELISELKSLEWIPTSYAVSSAIYSTPAILTQGWATENEMFKAIYNRVKDNDVKFGSYTLSDEGKKELKKEARNIPLREKVPFIEWTKEGEKYSLVLPFLKPIEEVKKYISSKEYLNEIEKKKASIEMKLTYLPKHDGSATSSFGMFGGALGGATSSEHNDIVFKKSWNIDEISDTPIDIYFLKNMVSYVDNSGIHQDTTHALSAKNVEPKVLTIDIRMPEGEIESYHYYFKKKQELKDIFFTIALASPDLPEKVLESMDKKKQKAFQGIKEITEFSTLQWINRNKIYKFIGLQTAYEKDLINQLKVQHSRASKLRVIIAKIEREPNKKVISSIDLRSIYPAVYGAKEKIASFNIMSGLFATQSEAKVTDGINVFSLWEEDKSLKILTILPSKKEPYLKYMTKSSVPKEIIKRLKESNNVWLFPQKPINKRYGWLEINPKNYQLISVLDTGEYGAMTEVILTQEHIETTTRYFLGLLIGSNIAVGSVINMALRTADYAVIKKDGHKLAKIIGCYVKKFESIAGDLKGTAQGAIKDEAKNRAKGGGGDSIDNMINSTFDCKNGGSSDDKKPKEYKDFINFGKGIDHAISQYFKSMN